MLSEYLDAELPEAACADIETHLAGCPPCIEFVQSLRKTIELCHEFQSAEMPPPMRDEARRELEAAYKRMLSARGV